MVEVMRDSRTNPSLRAARTTGSPSYPAVKLCNPAVFRVTFSSQERVGLDK